VSQIKANEKILKVTKFGLHKLKSFFNIKQFIGSGVNLTPASRRRVNRDPTSPQMCRYTTLCHNVDVSVSQNRFYGRRFIS